eukprot:SAG31_NODE_5448_length_2529_cov_2.282367_2_plen_212_part_00
MVSNSTDNTELLEVERQIADLKARAAALRIRATDLAAAKVAAQNAAAELAATRSYARSTAQCSVQQITEGCAAAVRRNGFCVIDNVVRAEDLDMVRAEVEHATTRISANREMVRALEHPNVAAKAGELVLRMPPAPLKALPHVDPANLVLFMPKFAEHFAHPAVLAVVRDLLDEHVRIAQINTRLQGVAPTGGWTSDAPDRREWHTGESGH